MNEYIIYCTKEQTKKALELGAPIEMDSHSHGMPYIQDKTNFFICPTAEQMIGWLEKQGLWEIQITRKWGYNGWYFYLYNSMGNDLVDFETAYLSRKGATLAAIDEALEYLNLINKKK